MSDLITDTTQPPATESATEQEPETATAVEQFHHTLNKRDAYALVRELRDQLADAGRPEASAADALLSILPPV